MSDYLSSLLIHKPDNVFKFTREYFSILSELPIVSKMVIIAGPRGSGKVT